MQIKKQAFNPIDMIEGCVTMAESLATDYSVVFTNRTYMEQFTDLLADETRVSQVLLNLLSNAVKYTSANTNVYFDCAMTTDGMLRFTVSDEGPGISKDKQEYLFEPFNRLDMEHGKTEGTGIGLTITKKLIEMMDGRIGLESIVGEGSKFLVDIPAAPIADK